MHKSGGPQDLNLAERGWPLSIDLIIRLPDESGKRAIVACYKRFGGVIVAFRHH